MGSVVTRIKHAWNAFRNKETEYPAYQFGSMSSSSYPLHRSYRPYSKSKFSQAIFNRIALDVATTNFRYVKMDKKTEDTEILEDKGLHKILTQEANVDQSHIQFLHDVAFSMMDEGVIAVIPVDTSITPTGDSGGIDYNTMRVGRVTQWQPDRVEVEAYNDTNGQFERVWANKRHVAIIENPLYAVLNGPNSTLTRLMSKMNLVDNLDQILSSGRLDIIIQMPFTTAHEKRKQQANERIKDIEENLGVGNNGIAYIDANEKVVQLNRAANSQIVENANLLKEEFYNQLGLTQGVIDGTATEAQMRLYYNRTIDPIIESIIAEFNRKFISKKARTEGHKIEAHRNLFDLMPTQAIATLGDTLRRNSVLTANEVRRLLGLPTHNDPSADTLANPNMPAKDQNYANPGSITSPDEEDEQEVANRQNGDNNIKEESNA